MQRDKLVFVSAAIGAILIISFLLLLPSILPSLYCRLTGGVFNQWATQSVGLQQMCIRQYQDAGKACTDSSQCRQGRCLYEESNNSIYREWAINFKTGQTLKVQGKCEGNDNPFKCRAEVKQGTIDSPIACVEPAH